MNDLYCLSLSEHDTGLCRAPIASVRIGGGSWDAVVCRRLLRRVGVVLLLAITTFVGATAALTPTTKATGRRLAIRQHGTVIAEIDHKVLRQRGAQVAEFEGRTVRQRSSVVAEYDGRFIRQHGTIVAEIDGRFVRPKIGVSWEIDKHGVIRRRGMPLYHLDGYTDTPTQRWRVAAFLLFFAS